MHGDTLGVIVILDPRDEHVYPNTVRCERGRARFYMGANATVTSPPRCHK